MKKLIPAICMVLVAATLLGTSTFAWFSMNTTVTATGMQVQVQSNSTFLLISKENQNATDIQNEKAIQVDFRMPATSVYPAKPKEAGEIGQDKIFASGTPVTNYATANVPANWYTANNGNPAHSTDTIKNITSLNDFNGYVIKQTVYLTLAVGAEDAYNLTVTPTFTKQNSEDSSVMDAVKVLVVTSENNMVTLTSGMSGAQDLYTGGNNTVLTDETVLTVDIYIYYDGSVDSVYTNNIANLSGAEISLVFNVAVKPNP